MTAIPWEATAALGAAAVTVLALPRAVRSVQGARIRRQRKDTGWTRPQRFLAAVLIVLGVGITIPAFTEIYLTVTHLVRPAFGDWAWTVPVAGEIAFTYLFLSGVLLAMKRAPAGVMRSVLMPVIIAGSVVLNIWAYLGSVPAITGHLIVVVAFFGVLLAGKETVMTLLGGEVKADRLRFGEWVAQPLRTLALWRWMKIWGEPSRKEAHDRYLRLLFAITIAKADERVGRCRRWWSAGYWRKHLPDVLRYQLATGTLPEPPAYGDWQEALSGHVTSQLKHLDARRSQVAAQSGTQVTPQAASQVVPQAASTPRRQAEARSRTDAELKPEIRRSARSFRKSNPGNDRGVITHVAGDLGIGRDRARRLLAELDASGLPSIEDRREARNAAVR